MLKKNVPITISPEDYDLLGDSEAERAAQLQSLLSSNLAELMRFYKFAKGITPTPAPTPKGRTAKGSPAPKEAPHLFSINNQ